MPVGIATGAGADGEPAGRRRSAENVAKSHEVSFGSKIAVLEHVPEKLPDFSDKNMLRSIDLERFLSDRMSSSDRKTLSELDADFEAIPLAP